MSNYLMIMIFFASFIIGNGVLSAREITLREAWEIAESNNSTIAQEVISTEVKNLNEKMAKTDFFPTLKFNAKAVYNSEFGVMEIDLPMSQTMKKNMGTHEIYDFNLSLQQPIFTGFRLSEQYKLAGNLAESQQIKTIMTEKDVYHRVSDAFCLIEYNHYRQNNLEISLQRIEDMLTHIKNLHQHGIATALDTLEIYTRKLDIENSLLILRDEELIHLDNLSYLLNTEENLHTVDLKNDEEFILPDKEGALKTAVLNRSELQILRKSIEAGSRSRKIATSALYPSIVGFAEYHYGNPNVQVTEAQWNNYYTAGINLSWDIWNTGKSFSRISSAKKETQRTELELQNASETVENQVINSLTKLEIIRKQFIMQEKQVKLEEEIFTQTSHGYDSGRKSSVDLRLAEEKLAEAQLKLSEHKIKWIQERLNLDFLCGVIGENLNSVFYDYKINLTPEEK